MSTAETIGTEYFNAWSSKDVSKATEFLTDDVEVFAPNGTFTGHDGYHEFMDFFVGLVTHVDDFVIHGDDQTATVWYNTHLQMVDSLVAGELLTLRGDKIARINITFDQMPLAQAFGGSAPEHK